MQPVKTSNEESYSACCGCCKSAASAGDDVDETIWQLLDSRTCCLRLPAAPSGRTWSDQKLEPSRSAVCPRL